jgi:hypothetical protein
MAMQGYLESLYLTDGYLSGHVQNYLGAQIDKKIEAHIFDLGSQIDLEIQDSNSVSVQVESKINLELDLGTQILKSILDYEQDNGVQVELEINYELPNGVQSELSILDENVLSTQIDKIATGYNVVSSQIERFIEDKIYNLSTQVDLEIQDSLSINMQIELKNIYSNPISTQIEKLIEDLSVPFGVEVVKGGLLHIPCPKYLMVPYLTDKYLAECFTTPMGTQIDLGVKERLDISAQIDKKINFEYPISTQVELRTHNVNEVSTQIDLKKYTDLQVGSQVEKRIDYININGVQIDSKIYHDNKIGSQINLHIMSSTDDIYLPIQIEMKINVYALNFNQVEKIIYVQNYLGVQVLKIGEVSHKTQVNKVLYNTTQLRILTDFASRGVPAQNGETWTNDVPDGIAEGDYDPNNLNTDILEQITKTAQGVRGFSIWCDTGKPNTYVDTIAILNHNFTKGAVVEIYGYTTNPNGAADITIRPTVELENTYWISPDVPSNPYRYWRIFVLDYGNPYALYMGVVVIGSSKIVSLAECFDNPVTFGFKHFKDTIETEGFSPVSNDRAIRKNLSLSFSMIKYNGGNYKMLRDYFITNKTDLKALVIPRPTNPSSLAVFSKLSVLPSESHTAITDEEHYVSLTLDYDESL